MLSFNLSNSVLILGAILLWVAYSLLKSYSYWSDRAVPYLKPIPFLGNVAPVVLGKNTLSMHLSKLYKEFEGHRFAGIFLLTKPILFVRDPSMIRQIIVKSFSSFHNRIEGDIHEEANPLAASVFHVVDQRWRDMRYKLSPTFSSNKLKVFYNHLASCRQALDAKLQGKVDSRNAEMEVHDLMSNYTLDVFAACIMGLECNTIRDGDSEFKQIALKFFHAGKKKQILNTMALVFPRLLRFFNAKLMNEDVEDFFLSVTEDAIKLRNAGSQKNQKDFIQFVVDLKENELKKSHQDKFKLEKATEMPSKENESEELKGDAGLLFTHNVIASNASIFIVAGFETTSSALAFTLYEMAANPDIQQRLHDEIKTHWPFPNLDIPFETLKKLTYADCVINESLRKYPISGTLFRTCTEDCHLPETNFTIEKGLLVMIPVHALHYDPKYFPDPEKFNPERFSEENKDKIVPGTYLPFGDGPRFCIGKRIALLAIKTMLVAVVSKYTIHLGKNMPKKLEFHKKKFILSSVEGIFLRFENRL